MFFCHPDERTVPKKIKKTATAFERSLAHNHNHRSDAPHDDKNKAAIGRYIRLFGLRSLGVLCDIRVGGRVKLSFGLSKMEIDTNVAMIARNVDNIATNMCAIDINRPKMHTNIAGASSNASEMHRARPETPSYLGETRFGGPDAGSNTANSSADGCGSQCDILGVGLHGQETGANMSRARANVSRRHRDKRVAECNVNVIHKNTF